MTRDEAVQRIMATKRGPSDGVANVVADALEALGVVTFDAPEPPTPHSIIVEAIGGELKEGSLRAGIILRRLAQHGYRIVREPVIRATVETRPKHWPTDATDWQSV